MLEEVGPNNQHEVGGVGRWRAIDKGDNGRRGDAARAKFGGKQWEGDNNGGHCRGLRRAVYRTRIFRDNPPGWRRGGMTDPSWFGGKRTWKKV